jgi:hypothetical protein
MSTAQSHLARRGALYYWRRRLPEPLNAALRRSHYALSLGTADPAQARRLARRLSVALDLFAEHIATMTVAETPSPGQLNLVLKRLFDEILEAGERRREARGAQPPALASGNRQRILDGEPDPDDLELLKVAAKNGELIDGKLPEEVAAEWAAFVEGNLVKEVRARLERALGIALEAGPSSRQTSDRKRTQRRRVAEEP